jgi:hypothetical protein
MTLFDISLPDLVTFLLLLSFSSWSLLKIYTQMETEIGVLKNRNALLSEWLQLAELQTGIPYYSSVAVSAVPHEHSNMFMRVVQNRVKALPFAPMFPPIPSNPSTGAPET